MSCSSPVRLDASSTPATNGMTSPARRTSTVSPILIPRARMTSWLASVARVTVVPPTNTGSSHATGAILPVLPTSHTTSLKHRRLLLGRELEGQRAAGRGRARPGGRERVPVGQPQHRAVEVVVERRRAPASIAVITVLRRGRVVAVPHARRVEAQRRAAPSSRSAAAPSDASRSNAKKCRRRSETVAGSFARIVPAAALRGLISGLSGCASL